MSRSASLNLIICIFFGVGVIFVIQEGNRKPTTITELTEMRIKEKQAPTFENFNELTIIEVKLIPETEFALLFLKRPTDGNVFQALISRSRMLEFLPGEKVAPKWIHFTPGGSLQQILVIPK